MRILSYLLIIVGVGFLAYGGYLWYYSTSSQKELTVEAQSLLAERDEKLLTTDRSKILDVATEFDPGIGEVAGMLHIPKLEADLPIVEGTDEDELAVGVGHYRGTAYPLQNEQIVLSGHRETVFRRMGELEIGDQ